MLKELQQTYKGKKVFITGHTGFKGAWLIKILSMLGADVKGYALATENEEDLFNLIGGSDICNSIIADIRDSSKLSSELISYRPDFVFHLAAQPIVRRSYLIPAETFEVNAIGTANLLDAIRNLQNRCQVVLITTDKVYQNKEWIYPYRENDRLGGYDPYSASKACAELVIDSYRNSFFNNATYSTHQKGIAVARAGNVIGGGDWTEDRLLPDVARALGNNLSVKMRNPISIRPWQHVLEPLCGYLLLGAKLQDAPVQYSQAYNFGPNTEDALTVEKMVELAVSAWGNGHYESVAQANQPHEAHLLKLDISKAINELNWNPKFNATAAVRATIAWYKLYYQNKSEIAEFTEIQINDFLENG